MNLSFSSSSRKSLALITKGLLFTELLGHQGSTDYISIYIYIVLDKRLTAEIGIRPEPNKASILV